MRFRVSRLAHDDDQALNLGLDVVAPRRHDPSEAVSLARADAVRKHASGQVVLVELSQADERAHFTNDESLARHFEEEHARPRGLGVTEARVHPLDRL